MHNVPEITVVIPGRNVADVVPLCLIALRDIEGTDRIAEIIFVDDNSSDATAAAVRSFDVRNLRGRGRGPAAARNLGWQAAATPLVWFLDADCVPASDALAPLLEGIQADRVAAVGSTFGNMRPYSLLASLIDAEIVVRHGRMPREVNYLAGGSLLCRKTALEEVGGFDESLPTAEDTDLAYRMQAAGWKLRFEPRSVVRHFHTNRLPYYLRAQRRHGRNRALVYRRFPRHIKGDHYSGPLDYIQPPLAMLVLGSLPLAFWPWGRWIPVGLVVLLVLIQVPMTLRIVVQSRRLSMLAFLPLGVVRSFARGLGMCQGLLAAATGTGESKPPCPRQTAASVSSKTCE